MKKIYIVIVLFFLISSNIFATLNYSLFINFTKSQNMMFFVLATDEEHFSVYADQLIASYLTKQGYTAEYVPDTSVLGARLAQIYNRNTRDSHIPEIYVITQKYFLVRTSSESMRGSVINEVSQGANIDIRMVNNIRAFNFYSAPVAAQADLFEKDEHITGGIDEVFARLLNDLFKK